jgi:hypothetical protein
MQPASGRILDRKGALLLDGVDGSLEVITDENGFKSWFFHFDLPADKLPIPPRKECSLFLDDGRKGDCYISSISPDFTTTLRGTGVLG